MEPISIDALPERNRGKRPELEIDWETIRKLPVGYAVDIGQEWPHLVEGRRVSSLVSILRTHIKRRGLHGLRPLQRNHKVYVTRTETDVETDNTEVN